MQSARVNQTLMSFSNYCLVQLMTVLNTSGNFKVQCEEVMEMADVAESSAHTLLAVEIQWPQGQKWPWWSQSLS